MLRSGYRLVLAFEEESSMPSTQAVYNNGLTETHLVNSSFKMTRFLVVRGDQDSLVQTLHARVEQAEKDARDALARATKAEGAAKETVSTLEAEKRHHQGTTSTLGTTREDLQRERTIRRKMEEDIAKIRTALGELRMREILGG